MNVEEIKDRIADLTMNPEERREFENERTRKIVESCNAVPGNLNFDHTNPMGRHVRGDGIDCPICKNRGNLMVAELDDRGYLVTYFKPCECIRRRMVVRRLRESGLERVVERFTFKNFDDREDWQQRMKAKALKYIREGIERGAWLYVGGQSGAGKSHLCTAVAVEVMKTYDLRYMVWTHDSQRIKALANDAEAYRREVEPLQRVKVLYIDDFMKPARNRDGMEAAASAADVRLAFDILNYRYVNRLPTIISSEWFSSELAVIDEAVAGRIAECCAGYKLDIKRDKDRNYRLRGREDVRSGDVQEAGG